MEADSPTLRSERLVLERYVPEDEEDFVALFGDPRVSRYMGDGPAPEEEDRALFWRVFSEVYERNAFDVWAVRENGALVGHAEIKPTKVSGGHELIYALAHSAWGRGLGTELARTVVAYGFETLGLSEVHATVSSENTASLAVMAKVGFEHVRDKVDDDGSVTRVLTVRRQRE
jgi:RimJ/RimL family protein N-acetyltransferase